MRLDIKRSDALGGRLVASYGIDLDVALDATLDLEPGRVPTLSVRLLLTAEALDAIEGVAGVDMADEAYEDEPRIGAADEFEDERERMLDRGDR